MVRTWTDKPADICKIYHESCPRILEIRYDNNNENDKKIMNEISNLIDSMQSTCFNCENVFYEGTFCGYNSLSCKVHGNIEYINHPHHDFDGSKCDDYIRRK